VAPEDNLAICSVQFLIKLLTSNMRHNIFNYIPEGDVIIRLTFFPNTQPSKEKAEQLLAAGVV
jgi:hypothetical protein